VTKTVADPVFFYGEAMNAKRWVAVGISALLLLLVILVANVAAGVGGEASTLNDQLKKDIADKADKAVAMGQIKQLGFESADSGSEITATGPRHSAIFYKTWLTVQVTLNAEGKTTGFKIDRQAAWF
jgi:hypothetical protein